MGKISPLLRAPYLIHRTPGGYTHASARARTILDVARLSSVEARTLRAMCELYASRQELHPSPSTLQSRLEDALLREYLAEIQRRGGETWIVTDRDGRGVGLRIVDRMRGLAVLRCEGWRYYSRRTPARRTALAYLCGRDDNGPFAARVPGETCTVRAALDALTPVPVRRAREQGRRVLRQGDVYLVETLRGGDNLDALPASHVWDAETRTLHHRPDDGRPHRPVHVPFTCRAYLQTATAMGRRGRRGAGWAD